MALWPLRGATKVRRAPVMCRSAASYLAGSAQAEPREIEPLVLAMRRDYQVRLAELVLVSNVKSLPVNFRTTGDDPRTVTLAKHLQTLWDNTLTDAMDFIAYGRVAFEKVYGFADGLTIIRSLDAMPFSRTELQLEDGAYSGFLLKGAGDPLEFSAAKSWWLALDAKPLEPHGRSRFIGAPHAVWAERCEAIRMRKLFIKRYVIIGGIAHVPMTVLNTHTGQEESNAANVAQQLDGLASGGYVIAPNSRDNEGNYDYEFDFPTIQDPAPIDALIDGLDAELLRAFCIPETTVTEGAAVGSYAANDQKMLILYCAVEDILSQLVRSFQRYVIDKLVALNGTQPITLDYQSLTEAKRQQELAQPLPNGQKPAVGAGEAGPAAASGTALQGQSRLQFVRNWKATDDILDKLAAGTITAARATIGLKGIGYSDEEAAALIDDATSEVAA